MDHWFRMVPVLSETLNLTEELTAAWEKIREGTRATVKPLLEQARQLREEIRTALEAGGADPATIGTKVIAAHELQGKVRAARDADREAFRALLTGDQQARLDAFEKEREAARPYRRTGPPLERF